MPNRRDVLTLGAAAALGGLALTKAASASESRPAPPTLQTRLFNFRDDVPAQTAAETVSKLRAFHDLSGVEGILVGRNLIPTPFPTRFAWIYMVQFARPAVHDMFQSAADALSSLCRNQVECNLATPLPPRFADAPGVGVRHTVMFDFKPDASPEDRERNVAAIRTMGKLPMVGHYVVERAAAHTPDPTQMEWQVIGDFKTVEDYQSYSKAPVHLAIRDDFTAHTSRVAFLDVKL